MLAVIAQFVSYISKTQLCFNFNLKMGCSKKDLHPIHRGNYCHRQRGYEKKNCLKNCLELFRMSREEERGISNFLHGNSYGSCQE